MRRSSPAFANFPISIRTSEIVRLLAKLTNIVPTTEA